MKQYSLFPLPPLVHGGQLASGRRKNSRPLAKNRPIHFVLKTKRPFSANGPLIMPYQKRNDWYRRPKSPK